VKVMTSGRGFLEAPLSEFSSSSSAPMSTQSTRRGRKPREHSFQQNKQIKTKQVRLKLVTQRYV
jgi:hypothetical protein